jgi:hypothetical protein
VLVYVFIHHLATTQISNLASMLYRLPVLTHLEGFYWCGDFSLVGGVVLHEY